MGFRRRLGIAVAIALTVAGDNARAAATLTDAIAAGVPIIDLRLRLEDVDQANKAEASLGHNHPRAARLFRTGDFLGFSALGRISKSVQHVGTQAFQ